MTSEDQKGNSSIVLIIFIAVLGILTFVLAAYSMLSNNIRDGKYINPDISFLTTRGSVYDSNTRAMATDNISYIISLNPAYIINIPEVARVASVYTNATPGEIEASCTLESTSFRVGSVNAENIAKFRNDMKKIGCSEDREYVVSRKIKRVYPNTVHASSFIKQMEASYKKTIFPTPGYNKTSATGKDLYLTLDMNVQYICDRAAEKISSSKDKTLCIVVTDESRKTILASSYLPLTEAENAKPFAAVVSGYGFIENNEDFDPALSKATDILNMPFCTQIKLPYEDAYTHCVYIASDSEIKETDIESIAGTIRIGLLSQSRISL